MKVPALVVAGTHSGVGKTTVTIAMIAALRRRGLRVQPFKIGPDFIDPSLHTRAAGCISRNLDGWMLPPEGNGAVFSNAARDADIVIVEGVMGLFDGRDAATDAGSTAEMAKMLGLPALLIVDGAAMARSVAAVVRGFEEFDPALDLAGVIFNRVAGPGHFAYMRDAVAAACRTQVAGWLANDERISLPERHLGLVMADEVLTDAHLGALADWIEATIDLSQLLRLSRTTASHSSSELPNEPASEPLSVNLPARIGVARDPAFCFYYQDNLDLLAQYGAELIEFSPMTEAHLPPRLNGIYFGGGYPELHAAALAANHSLKAEIARAARQGMPVYAECGGLMYLTEAIVDAGGRAHATVGLFPTRARMQERLAAIGYAEVEGVEENGWLSSGARARGHEFRYSTIDEMPAHIARSYRLVQGALARDEGYRVHQTLASYLHLHFASHRRFAARFVTACADFRE